MHFYNVIMAILVKKKINVLSLSYSSWFIRWTKKKKSLSGTACKTMLELNRTEYIFSSWYEKEKISISPNILLLKSIKNFY